MMQIVLNPVEFYGKLGTALASVLPCEGALLENQMCCVPFWKGCRVTFPGDWLLSVGCLTPANATDVFF